mmetsp:Transcript_120449/g.300481  ORF Transcript_120449/g.300481 Transcript_120449/m.300481 type:complete len:132 (+) Transcript_120449:1047-1442(+)
MPSTSSQAKGSLKLFASGSKPLLQVAMLCRIGSQECCKQWRLGGPAKVKVEACSRSDIHYFVSIAPSLCVATPNALYSLDRVTTHRPPSGGQGIHRVERSHPHVVARRCPAFGDKQTSLFEKTLVTVNRVG